MSAIKLFIAGKDKKFEKKIEGILKEEKEISIIGKTCNGKEVYELSFEKNANMCLVDEELEGITWQEVTQTLVNDFPTMMVVVVLNKYEKGKMKECITMGAREILEKPSLARNLKDTLIRLYNRELFLREENIPQKDTNKNHENAHIISIFSPKGGVGKTTVTANASVSIALEGKKVLVIDANLQFGDSSIALQVSPGLTITDIVKDMSILESLEPDEYLAKHSSGVYLLSAPTKPEDAELVTQEDLKEMIQKLKTKFEYIIIDCPNYFNELVLSCFDISNQVVLVSTLDITTIKNIRNALNLIYSLGYGKEKFQIVLNKVNEKFGIKIREFEETIGQKVWKVIPYDDRFVVETLNIGVPCVMKKPKHIVSRALLNLGKGLMVSQNSKYLTKKEEKNRGFLIWKFSR
jgi:pilus assembly protein CpaE